MKKKEDSDLFERVGPVRLYLDDIQGIIDTLTEANLTVSLSDSSHTFDSLDDVATARGERPRHLLVEGRLKGSGSVKLSFDDRVWLHGNVWLSTYGGAEMLRLGYQVREMLHRCIPRRAVVMRPTVFLQTFLFVLNVAAILLLGSALQVPVARPALNVAGFALIAALIAWLASIADRRLNLGIFLKRRHEGGFLKRNADQLLLLLVGAILGVFGTLIVQWLSK